MMSMLNQAAVEALCSATYLENYLDCMENLPDDLQRVVTKLRELDSQANEIIQDIAHQKELYLRQDDSSQKKRALIQIQRGLIHSQELGDEKLQLVSHIVEFIENRTRQLEQDLENLDPGTTQSTKSEEDHSSHSKASSTSHSFVVPKVHRPLEPEKIDNTKSKRQRRQRAAAEATKQEEEKKQEEEEKPKKKKKRKQKREKSGDKSPIEPPIDPDEPTYCLCEQVSYGEMIGCDYDGCAIEWFHFNCVALTNKPKGKWYCPKCRGDKPNLLRPDLAENLKKNK